MALRGAQSYLLLGSLFIVSGISGSKLQVFRQVGEPFLQALRIPYQIVGERRTLKRTIRDAHFMCRTSDMPAALLLTGEVLW